jgi:CubicO group peptidase (beta-lactamase class C family)
MRSRRDDVLRRGRVEDGKARADEGVRACAPRLRNSNAPDTQFGLASGAKGLALAVVSLIEDGTLDLDDRALALGPDLP